MQAPFMLAHDLGTTGNTATRFDAAGALIGSALAADPTAYPQPNWAEPDPAAWWQAVCTTHQLLAQSGLRADTIAAIGRCGQMMGCTLVDRRGQPLCSCIRWADQRAQGQAAEIAKRGGAATCARELLTSYADAY